MKTPVGNFSSHCTLWTDTQFTQSGDKKMLQWSCIYPSQRCQINWRENLYWTPSFCWKHCIDQVLKTKHKCIIYQLCIISLAAKFTVLLTQCIKRCQTPLKFDIAHTLRTRDLLQKHMMLARLWLWRWRNGIKDACSTLDIFNGCFYLFFICFDLFLYQRRVNIMHTHSW